MLFEAGIKAVFYGGPQLSRLKQISQGKSKSNKLKSMRYFYSGGQSVLIRLKCCTHHRRASDYTHTTSRWVIFQIADKYRAYRLLVSVDVIPNVSNGVPKPEILRQTVKLPIKINKPDQTGVLRMSAFCNTVQFLFIKLIHLWYGQMYMISFYVGN